MDVEAAITKHVVDKNRQTNLRYVYDTCAAIVYDQPRPLTPTIPSPSLFVSAYLNMYNGHISGQSPRITHSYPQLCNNKHRTGGVRRISGAGTETGAGIWSWTTAPPHQTAPHHTTQSLKSESSWSQLPHRAKPISTQNIRATN